MVLDMDTNHNVDFSQMDSSSEFYLTSNTGFEFAGVCK